MRQTRFLVYLALVILAVSSSALAAPAPGRGTSPPDRATRQKEIFNQAREQSRQRSEMLKQIPRRVFAIGYVAGGNYLATLGTGGQINGGGRLHNPDDGRMQAQFGSHSSAEAVAFAVSPDARRVAVAYQDAPTSLLELVLSPLHAPVNARPQGPPRGFTTLLFSPDSLTLATASAYDNRVGLHNSENGTLRQTLAGHDGPVTALAFSPDGKMLATASVDGTARLWSVPDRPAATSESRAIAPQNLPVSPAVGEARWVLQTLGGRVYSVAFSPDGRTLAVGHGAASVVGESVSPIVGGASLWDVRTGRRKARLEGHRGAVISLAFSPDGTRLATGSDDGTAMLWNVAPVRHRATLGGHERPVQVTFAPDSKTVATFDGSLRWETPDVWLRQTGVVRVWDAERGKLRFALEKPS